MSLLSMSHEQSVVSGLVLPCNEGHSVVLISYILRFFSYVLEYMEVLLTVLSDKNSRVFLS